MRRKKRVNGEKILSVVITGAIVLTLIVGVVSVVNNGKDNGNNNIVDLNESSQNDTDEDILGGISNKMAERIDEENINKLSEDGDISADNSTDTNINTDMGVGDEANEDEDENVAVDSPTGTPVKATASGMVESIYTDKELGNVIVVDMGNEYKMTYGLVDNVTVKKGEVILAGNPIANVSEPTAYYKNEGACLYCALTKDGGSIDPAAYME